ncbi:MAG: hypothetical protein ACI9MR_001201 [Myxococcota bacterium]|jgi:hypothetical protein
MDSDDNTRRGSRALVPARRWIDRARNRLTVEDGEGASAADRLAMRLFARADRIFDRLEETSVTLDRVAKTQESVMERLVPIVEDLGELVQLRLKQARQELLDSKKGKTNT